MKKTIWDKFTEFCQARLYGEKSCGDLIIEKIKPYLADGKITKIEILDNNKKIILIDDN